jgi:hypothetical protein
VIGSTGDRYANADENVRAKQNRAAAIRVTNLTANPVALTADASDCQVVSVGPVESHGRSNRIERVIENQILRKAPTDGAEPGSAKPIKRTDGQ